MELTEQGEALRQIVYEGGRRRDGHYAAPWQPPLPARLFGDG